MSEKLHPFVEDIGRWFDADVCDVRIECRLIGFQDRFGAVLSFLRAKNVVVRVTSTEGIKWEPHASILRFIESKGARSLDFGEKFEPSAGSAENPLKRDYEKELRRLWKRRGDFMVTKMIAAFANFTAGNTEIDGKDEGGMLRWSISEKGRLTLG